MPSLSNLLIIIMSVALYQRPSGTLSSVIICNLWSRISHPKNKLNNVTNTQHSFGVATGLIYRLGNKTTTGNQFQCKCRKKNDARYKNKTRVEGTAI